MDSDPGLTLYALLDFAQMIHYLYAIFSVCKMRNMMLQALQKNII